MSAHRLDVDHVHASRNFVNEDQGSNTTQQLRLLRAEQDEIISADRRQLQEISVLVKVVSVLLVMRNELLVVLGAAHEVILHELHKSVRVRVLLVVEV
jgi:hypothetical protein